MLDNVGEGSLVPATGPNFPTKLWLGVAGTAFLFSLINLCFGVAKKFDKGKCKSHNLEFSFGINLVLQTFNQSGSLSGSLRGKLEKVMRYCVYFSFFTSVYILINLPMEFHIFDSTISILRRTIQSSTVWHFELDFYILITKTIKY